MPFPDPRPLRILVIRYRFIGDTVLAIPFLRNLRQAFPGAKIDVLAEPVSGDTLALCPYKDELLFYGPRLKGERRRAANFPTSLPGAARFLRARRYDRCYILRRSFSSAILPLLAGIPHRVGFATEGRAWLLQRSTPYADRHEVECFLDILRADGIPVTDTRNENWTDPATDRRVDAALPAGDRPRVFVCAKSIVASKDWSPKNFAALIAWLVNERGCDIHLCDAPGNADYYAEIRAALPAPLARGWTDWSRQLSIREMGSLLRRMDLAVGIDTGLLHLAASFHVPVVALFGPLEPWRWHPWDTPHAILRPDDPSGPRPLLRLTLETVQAAVDRHLPPPPANLSRRKMEPPPAAASLTPLVVRFGAFGDMVLLIPMLKRLAQRYGRPCELVAAGPWTPPLMERVPACGPVRLLTSRRTPYWLNRSQWQLVAWLRQRAPGPVYVFEPDAKTHWLLQRGGIGPEWICSLRDLPRQAGENILHHALRVALETPVALPAAAFPPAGPEITPDARPAVTAADRRDCADWLARRGLAGAPLVLVQPGNKKTMRRGRRQRNTNFKYWPESAWAEVIRQVRGALPASRVVICGSPAERELAEAIRRESACEGVVTASDDLPIPRLLAVQETAHSMISVDTGPAHAAAAMGCPLVVLFARIDPALYAPTPTTAAVRLVVPPGPDPAAPMSMIDPATVVAAWRQLPARPPPPN